MKDATPPKIPPAHFRKPSCHNPKEYKSYLRGNSISVAVTDGIMVTRAIILAEVGSVAWTIRFGVVCASKNAIGAIFVQNVGVEEVADACRSCTGGVAEVVGTLFGTGSSADAGIVWLGHQEALDSHIRVRRRWRDDRSIAN